MNILEKAISIVSPEWAYKRSIFAEAVRSYDAGRIDRFNDTWTPIICSATTEPAADQITISKADLMQLQKNNTQQAETLTILKKELTIAKASLQRSDQASAEAKTSLQELQNQNQQLLQDSQTLKAQLTESQTALQQSQNQTAELKEELTLQSKKTAELQNKLTELSSLATNAKTSIDLANQYLQDTRNEYREREKEHERTESRLRTQKNIWQTIAGLAAVYAVSK